jgi:superfamily I DNA and/or RNA helicase
MMSRELDERVFVKNIENVQGDERDIILFSIAYAKNEEGRVYNRFKMLGN